MAAVISKRFVACRRRARPRRLRYAQAAVQCANASERAEHAARGRERAAAAYSRAHSGHLHSKRPTGQLCLLAGCAGAASKPSNCCGASIGGSSPYASGA